MYQFAPLRHRRLLALSAAIAAATIGAAGVGGATAPATGQTVSAATPAVCEIAVTETSGGVTFEARVTSHTPMTGTYQLAISRSGASGSAMINQSGTFRTTSANTPVTLGEATLGGRASSYDADLELRAGGERLRCTRVIAAR